MGEPSAVGSVMSSEMDEEKKRWQRQRVRSVAIALGLGFLVVLFYAATIVRMGGQVSPLIERLRVAEAPEKSETASRRDPVRRGTHRGVMFACLAAFAFMGGMSFAAVPLYRMFCQVTGYGGTTKRAEKASDHGREPVIRVRFDANVTPGMPWEFQPEQRYVDIKVGENTLAFYKATNTVERVRDGQRRASTSRPTSPGSTSTRSSASASPSRRCAAGQTSRYAGRRSSSIPRSRRTGTPTPSKLPSYTLSTHVRALQSEQRQAQTERAKELTLWSRSSVLNEKIKLRLFAPCRRGGAAQTAGEGSEDEKAGTTQTKMAEAQRRSTTTTTSSIRARGRSASAAASPPTASWRSGCARWVKALLIFRHAGPVVFFAACSAGSTSIAFMWWRDVHHRGQSQADHTPRRPASPPLRHPAVHRLRGDVLRRLVLGLSSTPALFPADEPINSSCATDFTGGVWPPKGHPDALIPGTCRCSTR